MCNKQEPQNTRLSQHNALERNLTMIKKGMSKRQIMVQLFILENNEYFESLSNKSKMIYTIERCDDKLQDWFF